MIDFMEIALDDIWDEPECQEIVDGLVYDGSDKDELFDRLSNSHIIAIHDGTKMLGFFSFDDLDCGECEAHIYVYKPFRNKSKCLIKECLEELTKGYGFKRVITTVTSDYAYISRFLKGLSFSLFGTLLNFITRNSIPLNVEVLVYEGEV